MAGKIGRKFYAIDLFAGCGGLSEGFIQAGFNVIAQVEMDKWSCETLHTRHIYHELQKRNKVYFYNKYLKGEATKEYIFNKFQDIKELVSSRVIRAKFGKTDFVEIIKKIKYTMKIHGASGFNVVIGGPPCQAYSLIGRSSSPCRMKDDERAFLYEYYFKILEYLQPDFFVFENVPGVITAETKGHEILKKITEDFRNIKPSYEIAYTFDERQVNYRDYILDCSNYGVPQKRKRIIFVGYKNSLLSKAGDVANIFKEIIKVAKPEYGGYTIADAIGDLPFIKPGEGSDRWAGEYIGKPITPYQQKMRKNSSGIVNFRARSHMTSDLERYKFFIEHHKNGNGAATLNDLINERPDLMPHHKNLHGFIDRFKVQWWNQPSSTIMSHICKDGHYYIHPDISQCRSFTVREAARCQSFPDNYFFEGPRTEQFKQVGNAVPPLVARAIAGCIRKKLARIYG